LVVAGAFVAADFSRRKRKLGETKCPEARRASPTHPNNSITGVPVENGGRETPVFLPISFSGTPSACSTVA
jgi:hypothetical protein